MTPDRKLTANGKQRLTAIMDRRRLENGDVMREIKIVPTSTSMSMALVRDTTLQQDLFDRLQDWVERNEAP